MLPDNVDVRALASNKTPSGIVPRVGGSVKGNCLHTQSLLVNYDLRRALLLAWPLHRVDQAILARAAALRERGRGQQPKDGETDA